MSDRPPSRPTRRRSDTGAGSITVSVIDEQTDGDAFPVDEPRWAALAEAVLEPYAGSSGAEVSVMFVDEARMAGLNEQFMGASGSTDVFAFPIDGDGPAEPVLDTVPSLLGDVVICPAVAARNAPEHAGSLVDEIALLLVHGLLHLLGMDHATDSERAVMQRRERELLDAHHGPLAGNPWS